MKSILMIATVLFVAGCIQSASILDPTTLSNFEASGMPLKEYGTVVDAVRSNRCDKMTANTVSSSGFVVLISCTNNDCTNDQRVKDFIQFGIDEERSYYDFSYPGGTSRQKVFAGDHGEIDYTRFGAGKKYGIELFPQSGAPNVGDQTCTFSYHVEFERVKVSDCRTTGCPSTQQCTAENNAFVCKSQSAGLEPAPPPVGNGNGSGLQPTLLDKIVTFINDIIEGIMGIFK